MTSYSSAVSRQCRPLVGGRQKTFRNATCNILAWCEKSADLPAPRYAPLISNTQVGQQRNYSARRMNQKKHATSPTASMIDDQWESSSSSPSTLMSENRQYQMKRIDERQQEFLQAMVDYRNLWYDPDPLNIPLHWKQATQFQHPTTGSWEVLVRSEETFGKICTLCHEMFVATASLTESDQSMTSNASTQSKKSKPAKDKVQVDWVQESQDFLTTILPFWETLRKERRTLVDRYSPTFKDDLEGKVEGQSKMDESDGNWMGWLNNIVKKETPGEDQTTTIPQVTAHLNPEFAPNHYHYTKLVGRLYFHFPQNASQDWLENRARQIQQIVDQSPSGKGESVLTDKIVRLYVRAYQDIGTLEASYQAEQVYHQYPAHRKRLLWYVLMSYLKVTQPTIEQPAASPKAAALATKRVCELLSSEHKRGKNNNEFHSWATIGFQCLANVHPIRRKSSAFSVDDYYDQVHKLCVQKFGEKTWKSLLDGKPDADALRPKDCKTLQILVQIYARDENYIERAQQLLDITWNIYPIGELEESFKRSTFHTILQTLCKRKKRKLRKQSFGGNTEKTFVDSSEDLNYALQLVNQKMMSRKSWWPTEDTFVALFRLTDVGPQADKVWSQLELCRALMQSYPLPLLKAAKYFLNTWRLSSEQGHPHAAERSLQTLRTLQVNSRPLLFDSEPEKVAHVYDPSNAPDEVIYSLVLKSWGASNDSKKKLEVAEYIYDSAKKDDAVFKPALYSSFFRCIGGCDEASSESRMELVRKYCDEVIESGKLTSSVLKSMKLYHPDVYAEYLKDKKINDSGSSQTDGPEDDDEQEWDVEEDESDTQNE